MVKLVSSYVISQKVAESVSEVRTYCTQLLFGSFQDSLSFFIVGDLFFLQCLPPLRSPPWLKKKREEEEKKACDIKSFFIRARLPCHLRPKLLNPSVP